jgi:D-aminopeptidase
MPANVFAAINSAKEGPLEEGAVGAGTGTVVFGFKAGIGTSAWRLPAPLGGYAAGCWSRQISAKLSALRVYRLPKN